MKRYFANLITLLLILSLIFSTACAPPAPPEVKPPPPPPPVEKPQPKPPEPEKPPPVPTFPITITDDLGRTVKIEKLPERIISLAPSNTELLFALGLSDRIVGVTAFCDYPEEAKTKPRIGGFYPPDIERVTAAKPDLVLAAKIHDKTVVPALEKLGLTVIALAPKTLDGVLKNITLAGEITGKSRDALRLVGQLNERVSAITAKTGGLAKEQCPRVLYVCWHDPIWAAGGGTFSDDIIQKAGGTNIFGGAFSEWRIVSLEEVVVRNPQVIVVSGMGATKGAVFNSVKNEPRLKPTEAIAKGQVYEIDGNLMERPGPRLVEALEQLAKLFHPALFSK